MLLSRKITPALLVLLSLCGCSLERLEAPADSGPAGGKEARTASSPDVVNHSTRNGGSWGSRQPDIIVVDAKGAPVAGATVTGVSLSISGQRTQTDVNGHATIPWAIQETKFVIVEKGGYRSANQIRVDQDKPIRITLHRSETAN